MTTYDELIDDEVHQLKFLAEAGDPDVVLRQTVTELVHLRRWKAEALIVLGYWDEAFDAAVNPKLGHADDLLLGASKAAFVRDLLRGLA